VNSDLPRGSRGKEEMLLAKRVGGVAVALVEPFTRIQLVLVKDGDIALYNGCMCIFSGAQIVGPNINGLEFFKRTAVECAWSL